ncbi:class I SAM-dependent methyltransferase [Endozoicomonas arenosclerae]|uniref:class I SAM-dependent methyltransferase n=1 Tax=Endozoicomonas arenosclerae TaxID=1633495 RepID=UPI0007846645|nr:class I SAM-dependent methyltransferase [Endozoicomonas arenosclerae]
MLIDYPLKTGTGGMHRLDVLNRLYNPTSLSVISRFIQSPEQENAPFSVLVAGCGIGWMSKEMACRWSHCQVLGIDRSHKQIDIAQSLPVCENLDFRCVSVHHLARENHQFHLIYLRWVVVYQENLVTFLEDLAACLAPGGVIIIEDNEPASPGVAIQGSAQHSEVQAVALWESVCRGVIRIIGQPEGLKDRLMGYFQTHGFNSELETVNQQVLKTAEEKLLLFLGIRESSESILKSGFSLPLLHRLLNGLYDLQQCESPIHFVRNYILCFRR